MNSAPEKVCDTVRSCREGGRTQDSARVFFRAVVTIGTCRVFWARYKNVACTNSKLGVLYTTIGGLSELPRSGARWLDRRVA